MNLSQHPSHSSPAILLLPFITLLIGGIAIGFAGIFVRLSDVNPIASAFWRMTLAAPFLWIWTIQTPSRTASQQTKTLSSTHFTPVLLWAGLNFAADMGLWHVALHMTTVANATLLSNLAPAFIALLLWKMYRIRFSNAFLIGLMVTLSGAALLVLGKNQAQSSSHHLLGDALGLLSALFYAGYQLAIKNARQFYSTARLMAWSTTITGLALLPFACLSPGHFFPEHASGWLPLFALALIAQIGGQTVIAYSSAHLPASLSSVGLLIQPLTATVAAWVLFQEAISPLQMIGGLLLLGGIYFCRQASGK